MENIKIYEVDVRAPVGAPDEGREFRYTVSAKNEESVQGIIDKYTKMVFGKKGRIREVLNIKDITPSKESVLDVTYI